MSDFYERSKPTMCDLNEQGVAPERLTVLHDEAVAFNQYLRAIEFDSRGESADATKFEANKNFYAFLGKDPDTKNKSNGDLLDAAGWALQSQLWSLPLEERRALLRLTTEENQILAKDDPAMSVFKVQKNREGVMEDVTITFPLPYKDTPPGQSKQYLDETFTFRGMVACRPEPILEHGFVRPNRFSD